ncbi:MAG: dipeptide ABC transporter ATP-binding protein [Actinomycetes bacterium]
MTRILLDVANVSKTYTIGSKLRKKSKDQVHAVNEVSFQLMQGETLGIVGESGCGKSTLGRMLVSLEAITSGTVDFDGHNLGKLGARKIRPLRKRFQMIFQDPYASLNPRRQIGKIIEEPLRIQGASREERKQRARELLEKVGLDANSYSKYPHEFSGGQRQRVVIARALALNPELVVADEPVSALDVSIQAQILNLFHDLQEEFGLTYIFIAHDLGVVRHVSDRIAVMYLGKIVELAHADSLYDSPAHPYSQALLSANPRMDTDETSTRIILTGDIPNPINRPSGCSFHPRCPIAVERCRNEEPPLIQMADRQVACHFPTI